MFIVYISHSKKLDRFYIGYTEDFEKSLDFHLDKSQERKFTYNVDDWEVFLKIDCDSKSQSLAIEKHIKSMKREIYVQNLLKYPDIISKLKNKYR